MKRTLMLAFVAVMLTLLGIQGKSPLDGPRLSVPLVRAAYRAGCSPSHKCSFVFNKLIMSACAGSCRAP